MKSIFICATAFAFIAGPAFAEDVIIQNDAPARDGVVVHRSVGPDVEKEKVITHDSNGCDSKTVTKSNDMGDTKSKTVTNC